MVCFSNPSTTETEFEASLVYIVRFRPAEGYIMRPRAQKNENNKNNENKNKTQRGKNGRREGKEGGRAYL